MAFALSGLLLGICLYGGLLHYEVNDDLAIIALLKGLYGLSAGADGVFISLPLGAILFTLYRLVPDWPWFSLLLYAGVFQGCWLASLTILETVRGIVARLAGLLIVVGLCAMIALAVSFTAVSALLWVAGAAWLYRAATSGEPRRFTNALAAALLAAAYLLRPDLLSLLLMLASPLLFALLGASRRVALAALAPLLCVLALSLACDALWRTGDAGRAFREFNRTRAEFTDTARCLPTPNTARALAAVDWTWADYTVARNWWLHDGAAFGRDRIAHFLETNAPATALFHSSMWQEEARRFAPFYLLLAGWALLLTISGGGWTRRRLLLSLLLLLLPLATVLLLMGVRFPLRIALPCLLALFLWGALLLRGGQDVAGRGWRVLAQALALLLLVGGGWLIHAETRASMDRGTRVLANKQYIDESLERAVALNGPDTIVVDLNPHILPLNYVPFREDDPALRVPTLLGGWMIESPVYFAFLERAGLGDRSTVIARMIDDPRVVLRFFDSPYLRFNQYVGGPFLTHLRQRYGSLHPGRSIEIEILSDDRRGSVGLVYLRLATRPQA